MIFVERIYYTHRTCQNRENYLLLEEAGFLPDDMVPGCVCRAGFFYEFDADGVEKCVTESDCGCTMPNNLGGYLPVSIFCKDIHHENMPI